MKWKHGEGGTYILVTNEGEPVATIRLDNGQWQIKAKNRNGGWNYASERMIHGAKAKAAKMIREEAT